MNPHWAATSATVGAHRGGQDRVGELQTAGEDVPGDGAAVGGEEPGELPLADADGGGDLGRAEVRVGQVLLYVGACGGAVGGGTGGARACRDRRDQVEHGPLVRPQRTLGPGGAAGDPGEGARVLVGPPRSGRPGVPPIRLIPPIRWRLARRRT